MTIRPIPLFKDPKKETPDAWLAYSTADANYGPELRDVYVDRNGYVHKRYGLSALGTTAELVGIGIEGIFYWENQGLLVVVYPDGNTNQVFLMDPDNSYALTTRGTLPGGHAARTRPSFGEDGSNFYLNCGASVIKYTGTTTAVGTAVGDADCPTDAKNILVFNKYLLAATPDEIHQSDVGDFDTWSGNEFASEYYPDEIVRAEKKGQNVYVFNRKSAEVFYDDGVTANLIRSPQGIIEGGAHEHDRIAYCPHLGTFLVYQDGVGLKYVDGNKLKQLSPELDRRLSQRRIETSTALYLEPFEVEGKAYVLIKGFGEDLVYDYQLGMVYTWSNWDSDLSNYQPFKANCFLSLNKEGILLVGTRADGVCEFSGKYIDDEDSDIIRSRIRTEGEARGEPGIEKECIAVHAHVRRTADVSGGNPQTIDLDIRYRDDGSQTWSSTRTMTLRSKTGAANSTDFWASDYQWGVYRIRQWEIVNKDSVPNCIVSLNEEYKYIR